MGSDFVKLINPIPCTNCGCHTINHIEIEGGSHHCKNCGRHCKWIWGIGADYCWVCRKYL